MGNSWLGRDRKKSRPWLNGYAPKRRKPLEEDNTINKVDNYAVIFYPIKCPQCQSKNVKCYSSIPGIRYYHCKNCRHRFKAIEAV